MTRTKYLKQNAARSAAFCYTIGMSWAAQRRFLILLIIGGAGTVFLGVVFLSNFYKAPSCVDNVQNQDERGVDCDGSCPYLCAAGQQPPTVLFTKALTNSEGRTDVVALVENKNPSSAAKSVPYRIALYDANQTLIQEVPGTFELPPGATVPIYLPGVASGQQRVAGAFLSIAAASPRWFTMATDSRVIPAIANIKQEGTIFAPRIKAILTNPSLTVLTNVQVIVMVRGEQGDVIAASKTIVPLIPAQDQATAIFTWNEPFPGVAVAIQVVPIIPLSDR